MAETTSNFADLQKYEPGYYFEYVRDSGLKEFMSASPMSIINVKTQTQSGGKLINIPLISASNRRQTGTRDLVGREIEVRNQDVAAFPYYQREATVVDQLQQHLSYVDLYKAQKDVLKYSDIDQMRGNFIHALGAIANDQTVLDYEDAHSQQVSLFEPTDTANLLTTARQNAWAAANEYRILAGGAESNYSATYSTLIGNVDAAAEAMSRDFVKVAKVMAKRRLRTGFGDSVDIPSIRPIRVTGGQEFFVMFHDQLSFKALKDDLETTNLDGRARDHRSNPVFQDGELIYDGVAHIEIPEIPAISSTVGTSFLCGAQAMAYARGSNQRFTQRDETDYGFKKGIGTQSHYSIEKMKYAPRGTTAPMDHGVLTCFTYTG
ncbi:MAG: DUF4043 family protein [Pseudomonadota bacterium]